MTNEAVNRTAWHQASRHGENSGGDTGAAARILIVDDDFEMRHMIRNYLTAQNLRAIPVQGRQEMARQFAVGEPSLVVLDLCLGEEDGLDLLRDIRSRSNVPVISPPVIGAMRSMWCSALNSAPTITWQNRSDCVSCLRASVPCYAAGTRSLIQESGTGSPDDIGLAAGSLIATGDA